MKQMQILIFGSMLLFFAAALKAEEIRYYDIELIIFESTDPIARHSEVQKNNLNREVPAEFVELGKPYPGPLPKEFDPKLTFKQLGSKTYQLNNDEKLLKESKNYNILLHTAWRQPGMNESIALPVHLHQEYVYRTANTQQTSESTSAMFGLSQPATETQTRGILDGYIRIILSRYLHAEVDLSYIVGIKPQQDIIVSEDKIDPVESEPLFFRLKQSRKMRSKEVHYLDHPVLGVIITATPYNEEPARSGKSR